MATATHAATLTMAQHFDAWLERLRSDNFPVLRRTAKEIARLAAKGEKASVAEIADAILHDPLATLKLLQVANSLRRGRFGSEITTIEHAVMMLGLPPFFARFRNLSVVEDELREQPQALHRVLCLLSRSHHAAVQAGDLAVWHKDMKAEEIYIAALLQGWLAPLLWLRAPDAAAECERRARKGQFRLQPRRRKCWGWRRRICSRRWRRRGICRNCWWT
jgi:HD-like signal output (HDOD) protein